jgi:hypothetical protein
MKKLIIIIASVFALAAHALEVTDDFRYDTKAIANLATGGVIGTAATTVDVLASFNLSQSTAGQTVTLPSPTDPNGNKVVLLTNVGSASFNTYGAIVQPTQSTQIVWSGASWKGVAPSDKDLYRDGGKANLLMTGGGTVAVSAAGEVSWTQRLIILGGGRGAGAISTSGYYDINLPPAGTVITGICGAGNTTVTSAGVNLMNNSGAWAALWYQLPLGGNGSVAANFRLSAYTGDCVIPSDYVLVAVSNNEAQTVKMGTGQIIKVGQNSASGGNDVIGFRPLNDGRNTADGLTWYTPAPASYGIYRTPGAWSGGDYQQLKIAFDTGIELQPSIAASAAPSYGKSYVNISAGGLRVERGNTGLGTLTPTEKLEVAGKIKVTGLTNYATTAAAIADAALTVGTMYTVTTAGAKALFIK